MDEPGGPFASRLQHLPSERSSQSRTIHLLHNRGDPEYPSSKERRMNEANMISQTAGKWPFAQQPHVRRNLDGC